MVNDLFQIFLSHFEFTFYKKELVVISVKKQNIQIYLNLKHKNWYYNVKQTYLSGGQTVCNIYYLKILL